MEFKKIELRLVNRAGAHYLGALRCLALLPLTRSPRERRQVFERVKESLARVSRTIREFRAIYPRAAPAENLIGAACFRGAVEFAKEKDFSEFAYALSLLDGEMRGNFIGPISSDEEEEEKKKGNLLVRGLSGEPYRLFSPEKPASRFYAQQLQNIAAQIRKKEAETRRREEVRRNSVSARDLLISFRGVFAVSHSLNGRPIYLELEGNGLEIKVVRAEGIAEDLLGKSFGRGRLPGVIFREIKLKEGEGGDRRENRRRRSCPVLRLVYHKPKTGTA
jgi:hypothetical protein